MHLQVYLNNANQQTRQRQLKQQHNSSCCGAKFTAQKNTGDRGLKEQEAAMPTELSAVSNATAEPSAAADADNTAPLTLYGVMAFAIMVANSLVLVLVWRKSELRSVSNSFLASLAVSDLLTGLVAIPLVIACSATLLQDLCVSMDIVNRLLAFSSVGHLTVLSVDRYVRIVRPLQYPALVTAGRAARVLASLWGAALCASAMQLFWIKLVHDDDTLVRIELAYNFFCLAFVVIIPLIVMSTIYVRIFHKLTARTLQTGIEMATANEPRRNAGRRRANERKVALLFIAMVTIFILGLGMYFSSTIIIDFENLGQSILRAEHINVIEGYVLFFRFFTALGNPLLCAFFKNDFRAALKRLFNRQ